jgi:integrase
MKNPSDRTVNRIRKAATARAAGATMREAAHAARISHQALDGLRTRHRALWDELCERARAEHSANEASAPPIPEPVEDLGITAEARRGIQDAVALLAAGCTVDEATKKLRLPPNAIDHWQRNYRQYWRRAYAVAIATARNVLHCLAGMKSKNPSAFLRQLETIERGEVAPEDLDLQPMSALSAEMTLPDFYRAYVKPVALEARGSRGRTFDQYEGALRTWARLVGDVPLAKIDAVTCATFMRDLRKVNSPLSHSPLSPNTCRKIAFHVQRCIDLAAPRSRSNRMGAGLIADAPYIERPRGRAKEKIDAYTPDEIGVLLQVCEKATRPELPGIAPADWWRALIVFSWNTGTRISQALQLERRMIQGRWLVCPAAIMKGNTAKRICLTDEALAAIESIRTKDAKLFPWPYGEHYFHACRRALFAQSSLPVDRRFGMHAIRRGLATELAKVNPLVAQQMLGHTSMGVTRDYYVDPGIAAGVLAQIPQPTAAG